MSWASSRLPMFLTMKRCKRVPCVCTRLRNSSSRSSTASTTSTETGSGAAITDRPFQVHRSFAGRIQPPAKLQAPPTEWAPTRRASPFAESFPYVSPFSYYLISGCSVLHRSHRPNRLGWGGTLGGNCSQNHSARFITELRFRLEVKTSVRRRSTLAIDLSNRIEIVRACMSPIQGNLKRIFRIVK